MAQGTLDIGVVLQGFGIANEQLGILQNSFRNLGTTLQQERRIQRSATRDSEEFRDSIQRASEASLDFASTLTSNLAVTLKNVTDSLRESAIQAENFRRQITAVGRDGENAGNSLERLFDIAKRPGLELEQTAKAVTALRATRMSAQDAEETVIQFGNALASVGAGTYELQGTVTALSQIMSKGKVFAEEIYQIAERLPQTRVIMEDAFGTADTEVLAKEGLRSIDFIKAMNRGLADLNRVAPGTQENIKNLDNEFTKLRMNLAGQQKVFNFFTGILTNILDAINSLPKPILVTVGALTTLASAVAQVTAVYYGISAVLKAFSILNGLDNTIVATKLPLLKAQNALLWGQLYVEKALLAVKALTGKQWLILAGVLATVGLAVAGIIALFKKFGKGAKTASDWTEEFKVQTERAESSLSLLNDEKRSFAKMSEFKNAILEDVSALQKLNAEIEGGNDLLRTQRDLRIKEGTDLQTDTASPQEITERAKANLETITSSDERGKIRKSLEENLDSFFESFEGRFSFEGGEEWINKKEELKQKLLNNADKKGARNDLIGILEDAYEQTSVFIQGEIDNLETIRDSQQKEVSRLKAEKPGWTSTIGLKKLSRTQWADDFNEALKRKFKEDGDQAFKQFNLRSTNVLQSLGQMSVNRRKQILDLIDLVPVGTEEELLSQREEMKNEIKQRRANIEKLKETLAGKKYDTFRQDNLEIANKITENLDTVNEQIRNLGAGRLEIRTIIEGFQRYSQNIDNMKENLNLEAERVSKLSSEQLSKLSKETLGIDKADYASDPVYQRARAKLEMENELRLSVIQDSMSGLDNLTEFIALKRSDVLAMLFDEGKEYEKFFDRFKVGEDAESAWDTNIDLQGLFKGKGAEEAQRVQKALRMGLAQQYIQTIAGRRTDIDEGLKAAMDASLQKVFRNVGIIAKNETLDLEKTLEKYGLLSKKDGKSQLNWGDIEDTAGGMYEAKGTEPEQLVLNWIKALKTMNVAENISTMDYNQLISNVDYMGETIGRSIKEAQEQMNVWKAQVGAEDSAVQLNADINEIERKISQIGSDFESDGDKIAQAILGIALKRKQLQLKRLQANDDEVAGIDAEISLIDQGIHAENLKVSKLIARQKITHDEAKLEAEISFNQQRIAKLKSGFNTTFKATRDTKIAEINGLIELDQAQLKVNQAQQKFTQEKNKLMLLTKQDEKVALETEDARFRNFQTAHQRLLKAKNEQNKVIIETGDAVRVARIQEELSMSLQDITARVGQKQQELSKLQGEMAKEEGQAGNELLQAQQKVESTKLQTELNYWKAKETLAKLKARRKEERGKDSILDGDIRDAELEVARLKDYMDVLKKQEEFYLKLGTLQERIAIKQGKLQRKHTTEGQLYQGGMSQQDIKQRGIYQQREMQETRRDMIKDILKEQQAIDDLERIRQVGTEQVVGKDEKGQDIKRKITWGDLTDVFKIPEDTIQDLLKAQSALEDLNNTLGKSKLDGKSRKEIGEALDLYQGYLDLGQHNLAVDQWKKIVKLVKENGGDLGIQEILLDKLTDSERKRNKTIKDRDSLLERQNKSLEIQQSLLESLSIDPQMLSGVDTDQIAKSMGLDEGIFNRMKDKTKANRDFMVAEQKMEKERQELENKRIHIESANWGVEIKDDQVRADARKQALIDWNHDYLLLQTKHIADIININQQRKQALLQGFTDFKNNMNELQNLRDRYELAQFDIENARNSDSQSIQKQRKQIELQQKANQIMRESADAIENYMLKTTGQEDRFDLKGMIKAGDTDSLIEYQKAINSVVKTISDMTELEATLAKENISKRNDMANHQQKFNSKMQSMEQQHQDKMHDIRVKADERMEAVVFGTTADRMERQKQINALALEQEEEARSQYQSSVQKAEADHQKSMSKAQEGRSGRIGIDTDWFGNLMGSDIGLEASKMFKQLQESMGEEGKKFNIGTKSGLSDMLMSGGFLNAQTGAVNFTKLASTISTGDEDAQNRLKDLTTKMQAQANKNLSPIAQNTSALQESTKSIWELITTIKNLIVGSGTSNVAEQTSTTNLPSNPIPTQPSSDVISENSASPIEARTPVTVKVNGQSVESVVEKGRQDGTTQSSIFTKLFNFVNQPIEAESEELRLKEQARLRAKNKGIKGERTVGGLQRTNLVADHLQNNANAPARGLKKVFQDWEPKPGNIRDAHNPRGGGNWRRK